MTELNTVNQLAQAEQQIKHEVLPPLAEVEREYRIMLAEIRAAKAAADFSFRKTLLDWHLRETGKRGGPCRTSHD